MERQQVEAERADDSIRSLAVKGRKQKGLDKDRDHACAKQTDKQKITS